MFVQTGKESDVCIRMIDILERNRCNVEYKLLVPRRRIREKHHGTFVEIESTMFPGYVLISSTDIMKLYQLIKRCKGLYRFLRVDGEFQQIMENEIANIINMMDENGIIGISDIFIEKDIVKVIAGPLCNYKGKVMKIDKHKQRAKVALDFNGKEHIIDLSINMIYKIDEAYVQATLPMLRKIDSADESK